jgi:palmitoyltransferase
MIALTLLFLRTIWNMMWNITTIENWEIDRHETLLRRAKASGGFLDGPYDIGIWANFKQAMGSGNVRESS